MPDAEEQESGTNLPQAAIVQAAAAAQGAEEPPQYSDPSSTQHGRRR